ncbi:MAG: metallophosphoesterase [Verrucomicrobiota bacterium]|nr:metallophosphoesterase [Verrucomicrobiota bacterium]
MQKRSSPSGAAEADPERSLFAQLLQPLREAGVPVHLTLGNHDERDVFYSALARERPSAPAVVSRHVAVVKTARANFFLLDSLKQTMIAPGDLGDEQLKWLTAGLDTHRDKPAIIMVHHNPRLGGDPKHFPGGLMDSQPLWDVLETRRHVKAYLHGHVHDWGLAAHAEIHIVNTPATSYVANPQVSTTGWTMARLRDEGLGLTTRTHLTGHEWNHKSHELSWRV